MKAVRVGSPDELIIGERPMAKAFSWCRCPQDTAPGATANRGIPGLWRATGLGIPPQAVARRHLHGEPPKKVPPLIFLLLHLPLDSFASWESGMLVPRRAPEAPNPAPLQGEHHTLGILFRTIHLPHTSAQKSVPAAWAPPERVGDRLRGGAGRKLEGAGTG